MDGAHHMLDELPLQHFFVAVGRALMGRRLMMPTTSDERPTAVMRPSRPAALLQLIRSCSSCLGKGNDDSHGKPIRENSRAVRFRAFLSSSTGTLARSVSKDTRIHTISNVVPRYNVLYVGSPVLVVPLPDSTAVSRAFDPEGASNLVWLHMAASAMSLAKDLIIERLGKHKNRVLSTTDRWQVAKAGSSGGRASGKSDAAAVREEHELPRMQEEDSATLGQDGIIKEVVGGQRREDGSGESGYRRDVGEQNGKEVGRQLPHATNMLRKNGSDGPKMDDSSRLRTVGTLNPSSIKDGRIDYGEFVDMMTKGNMGVGRRTMRNSLNISMRDAPGAF